MSKDQWTEEVFRELCRQFGESANQPDGTHLRMWAESIAECYYDEEPNECTLTPKEAVEEELSRSEG